MLQPFSEESSIKKVAVQVSVDAMVWCSIETVFDPKVVLYKDVFLEESITCHFILASRMKLDRFKMVIQ